jgi:Sortase domain
MRAGAGMSLLASGAALSVATLIIGLAQPTRAANPLSLRVLGPPPVPVVAADRPVSSSSPPVAVSIPAIAVNSILEGLRLNGDGSLQTPRDPNRAGWYADGPAPGDQGAAVFVGHLDSRTGPAVFWRLASLLRGDQILVRRADGRTLTFVVDHSAVFPRTNLPTATVFGATGSELHLITCNGSWDAQIGRYDHSLVVFARLADIDNVAVSPPSPTARLVGAQ